MSARRPGDRLVLAAAAALALGACSHPSSTGMPASSRAPSSSAAGGAPSVSPSASASASSAPRRLRVRSADFRLPAAFAREAVVGSGCTAIVAGGLVGGDSSTAKAYRLDLQRGHVSALPPLAVPVHDTAGASGSGPLVVGGGNSSEQSVVQGWDGSAWKIVGHLPQARSDLVAATVGGRVVVAGGYDGSRPAEADILSSTDGRSWKVVGTLPVPVRYPASTVADGAIWLIGGESSGAMQTAIQRIDPTTGHARVVGRLPLRLGHAVAIPFGTRVLVAGGRTGTDTLTDRMWWFDPRSGAVTAAGRLPHPLADSAVASCGGADYLIGGETPGVTDQVLEVTDS